MHVCCLFACEVPVFPSVSNSFSYILLSPSSTTTTTAAPHSILALGQRPGDSNHQVRSPRRAHQRRSRGLRRPHDPGRLGHVRQVRHAALRVRPISGVGAGLDFGGHQVRVREAARRHHHPLRRAAHPGFFPVEMNGFVVWWRREREGGKRYTQKYKVWKLRLWQAEMI